MVDLEMDQEQLIRCIEQQLDNLSYINEDLFNQYCDLYYDNDEPIVELFTPELLVKLEEIAYENHTKSS
jgi:hypothetical protein